MFWNARASAPTNVRVCPDPKFLWSLLQPRPFSPQGVYRDSTLLQGNHVPTVQRWPGPDCYVS